MLVDGRQVELGAWRDCADEFVGPDIDHTNKVLARLRQVMDERYDALLNAGRRKVSSRSGMLPIVVVFDELTYFSATVGDREQQNEFTTAVRDLVARGRAAGVVVVAATQRPSADIIQTSLRDLFGYRWAFGRTTPASSDIVLGHGWAAQGYSATDINRLHAASAGCSPRVALVAGCARPVWTTSRCAGWQRQQLGSGPTRRSQSDRATIRPLSYSAAPSALSL